MSTSTNSVMRPNCPRRSISSRLWVSKRNVEVIQNKCRRRLSCVVVIALRTLGRVPHQRVRLYAQRRQYVFSQLRHGHALVPSNPGTERYVLGEGTREHVNLSRRCTLINISDQRPRRHHRAVPTLQLDTNQSTTTC